ncbi:MCP four helix bundle domain-containing protein, partial [Candidatus Methylomirabilis sp.]|uniref:MCP four helix bundle domain-containing protein n=1 Tax=Candidatus Methylomirabilis sp. TaxID=2032687 RepID=UPI003C729950
MRWTVGQRITVGYAVILVLLVVAAGAGMFALSRIAGTFETVIRQHEQGIETALEARGDADRAVVSFFRYLQTRQEQFLKDRDRQLAEAREAMTRLRDTSATAEAKKGWEESLGLLNAWDEASSAMIAATKARREVEAIRILTERTAPAHDQLRPLVRRLVDAERVRTKEITASAVAVASRTFW